MCITSCRACAHGLIIFSLYRDPIPINYCGKSLRYHMVKERMYMYGHNIIMLVGEHIYGRSEFMINCLGRIIFPGVNAGLNYYCNMMVLTKGASVTGRIGFKLWV